MTKTTELPDSIKHVETGSKEWYEAEFESMTEAEVVRNSGTVDLHETDDLREKTVRLETDNSQTTLEQVAKNAVEQPDIPDEW